MVKSSRVWFGWALSLAVATTAAGEERARNVVLMVADGAGFNSWKATAMYEGTTGRQFFDEEGWLRSALSTPNLRRSADATRGALLDSRIGQNLAVSRVDFPRGETRGSGNVVIFFSSTGNSVLVEYEIGITIV